MVGEGDPGIVASKVVPNDVLVSADMRPSRVADHIPTAVRPGCRMQLTWQATVRLHVASPLQVEGTPLVTRISVPGANKGGEPGTKTLHLYLLCLLSACCAYFQSWVQHYFFQFAPLLAVLAFSLG